MWGRAHSHCGPASAGTSEGLQGPRPLIQQLRLCDRLEGNPLRFRKGHMRNNVQNGVAGASTGAVRPSWPVSDPLTAPHVLPFPRGHSFTLLDLGHLPCKTGMMHTCWRHSCGRAQPTSTYCCGTSQTAVLWSATFPIPQTATPRLRAVTEQRRGRGKVNFRAG